MAARAQDSVDAASGLVSAMPGILVMVLGAAIAKRQMPGLDAIHARREDARRRVSLYRETERVVL